MIPAIASLREVAGVSFLSGLRGDKTMLAPVRARYQPDRVRWREAFGVTKEDPDPGRRRLAKEAGSFGASGPSAMQISRLLQAMRSRAPGGWTDDRWEQTMRHFTGIAYVAIHRLCCHFMQAEFDVFRRPTGRGRADLIPVTEDDPPQGGRYSRPYDLVELLQKPNNGDSWGKLMYKWFQQKMLTGSALTWMVPNRLGYPMELYPLPTATAIPQPAVNPIYPHGYYRVQPLYPYGPFSSYPSPTASIGAPIPAQWVLAFRYPHPLLRYEGYSPLTAMRLQMDAIDGVDRSRWYSMKRSINPSGIVNMANVEGTEPLPDEEVDRMRSLWEEYQGPEGSGSLLIMPPGASLDGFGGRPVDMDYQAGWDQLANFVFGGFGITKPAAGLIEDTNYSVLFATLKQLDMITLSPECDAIASELTRHLAPFFGDDLIVKIRTKPINDHEVMLGNINTGMNARCITKNEVRAAMKMPKTDQPWGDEIAGTDPAPPPGAEQGLPPVPGPEGAGQPEGAVPGEDDQFAELDDLSNPNARDSYELEEDNARPRAGGLARGALGPRQASLPPRLHRRKTFYELAMEGIANGNGH